MITSKFCGWSDPSSVASFVPATYWDWIFSNADDQWLSLFSYMGNFGTQQKLWSKVNVVTKNHFFNLYYFTTKQMAKIRLNEFHRMSDRSSFRPYLLSSWSYFWTQSLGCRELSSIIQAFFTIQILPFLGGCPNWNGQGCTIWWKLQNNIFW